MKQKLLKTMMLALMIVGGASSAWGKVIYPSKMNNFRTNSSTPTAWTGGDWGSPITIKDGASLTQVEVNTQAANIWVLEQFVIPNIDKVTNITITQKKVEKSNGAIWYFPYDYPTSNAYDATYVENVKTVLGVYPGAAYTNAPIVDDVSSATVSLGDIDVIKSTYASYITTDNTLTLNLLLTTKTGAKGQGKFYTQNEENGGNRPYITVTYAVYNATTGTNYNTLNEAIAAASTSSDIYLYDDCTVTDRAATAARNITLNIIPQNDVTITAPSLVREKMWVLGNQSGTTLNIGSDSHTITFQSTGSSRVILNNVCAAENGTMNLTNVVFDNIEFSGDASNHIGKAVYYKSGATGTLRNVAFKNCKISTISGKEDFTPKAIIYTEDTHNDRLFLDKSLNFDSDCSTPHIYAKGCMRMTEADRESFTYDEPIQILWDGSSSNIGTNVIGRISGTYKDAFQLANGNCMSLDINKNNWTDLYITQTYPLNVSTYEAATLVLPFESTIPDGVEAYTLNYNGGETVTATPVTTTLPANTPVLINASEGAYTFKTTATTGAVATGSGPVTIGALTGVYTETTVPESSYILWANAENPIGFYQVDGSTNKVAAYRAYLTAEGTGVKALTVDYDGSETGISETMKNTENEKKNNAVFDLSGRRVVKPTKGMYIVNGKKVVK